jgi:UDP-2,3-diacylglucosamine pyrophosphatase LpxH
MRIMQENKCLSINILSDLHLGIYGCQADQILRYLDTIDPDILILNGDIVDMWNQSKYTFTSTHIMVIKRILDFIQKGTEVYYITGNHDEVFRKISGLSIKNLHIKDHLLLDIDNHKTWIFHGDIFDASTKGWSRILAKLGGKGYDILIFINRLINKVLEVFGQEKISMSKRIKSGIKAAVKWVNNFEDTAIDLALQQGFDVVICGHIHRPIIKPVDKNKSSVLYLNSGDWVENCTALEYKNHTWSLVQFAKEEIQVLDKYTMPIKAKSETTDRQNEVSPDMEFAFFNQLMSSIKI